MDPIQTSGLMVRNLLTGLSGLIIMFMIRTAVSTAIKNNPIKISNSGLYKASHDTNDSKPNAAMGAK